MTTDYVYQLTDFPNHVVAPDRLTQEIRSSAVAGALDGINVDGSTCTVMLRASVSGDQAKLDALVAAHDGTPLPSAAPPVQMTLVTLKPSGSRANFFTHSWCDPTTWYQQSVRVVDETPSPVGSDSRVFELAHPCVIDTYHGLITQEDFLLDAGGHSYRVGVKVDGVTKTEQDPHYGTGGDYVVAYATGRVTFLAPQTGAVTVTYHYADGSRFTFGPAVGKKLTLDLCEVQFALDIDIQDTLRYNAFGYVDVFAPQLLVANGGPLPSGTKIPLGPDFVYKTLSDYLNDSIGTWPQYPALGGPGWRGISQSSTVFKWDYIRSLELSAAAGMEIRMWLEHETPFGGDFATATFYCGSAAEV